MKRIIIIISLFLIVSCGYQPLYLDNNLNKIKFYQINLDGDNDINKKIIKQIIIEENDKELNKLYISSSKKTEEISKDRKGKVKIYKNIIDVKLEVRDFNNKIVKYKNFSKDSTYDNKENKYELIQLQNSIENILVHEIISEIIIFLNS